MAFQQAACLADQPGTRAALIAGTLPDAPAPVPAFALPGLDYDSFTGLGQGAEGEAALASSLSDILRQAFPDGCDLLHVHNPMLRKNARLAGALRRLQKDGLRLLVQEHDFAEDFRPAVYDSEPYLEGCDYAVINPRDRRHLIAAGLEPRQVHYLPNPVADAPFLTRSQETPGSGRVRGTALYPVRAIRRKNVGEAVLLSRFLPNGTRLAVTLPPTSDADRPAYENWKLVAVDTGERIDFDAGLSASLDDLYARSFCAVTTSVKEGFGYSYLDPLVRGLPVIGRAVPSAVEIFDEAGLALDGLYTEIRVPRDAVPEAELRAAVDGRLAALKDAFAPALRQSAAWERVETRLSARFAGPWIDFGALDEPLQVQVLARLAEPDFAARVAALNPFLETLFSQPQSDEGALRRRNAALAGFSKEAYGRRLAAAYEKAASRPGGGAIDKTKLAEAFLDPRAFFLAAS